jgi:hypothetical protein
LCISWQAIDPEIAGSRLPPGCPAVVPKPRGGAWWRPFSCAGCRTQGKTEARMRFAGDECQARLRPLEAAAHAETLTIVVHGDADPVPSDPFAPALLPAAEDEP